MEKTKYYGYWYANNGTHGNVNGNNLRELKSTLSAIVHGNVFPSNNGGYRIFDTDDTDFAIPVYQVIIKRGKK